MRGLLLQRRRWLNGTFHCLLYLTTVSPHLMNESLVFAPENTAIENSVNRGEGEEIQPLQQRTNCCRHALSCKYYKTKIGFLLTWLLYLVQVVNFVGEWPSSWSVPFVCFLPPFSWGRELHPSHSIESFHRSHRVAFRPSSPFWGRHREER